MIHNKGHHDNRHSREGGNPAIQKCFGFTHWITSFTKGRQSTISRSGCGIDTAGMTKIFIAIYMLAPLMLTNSAQAGSLGRLFFTPEQRAQLEQNRTRSATAEDGSSSSVLTVNGIVQKKGGARTVWINGVAQSAGNSDESSPESLPVSVPGQSHPVKVKVGQKLTLDQPAQPNPPASAPQKQPASDE